MNEAQALQVCGCFAVGLDVGFAIGGKYYHLHKSESDFRLMVKQIGEDGFQIIRFEVVVDVSVNENYLVIDLFDLQLRFDLEESE